MRLRLSVLLSLEALVFIIIFFFSQRSDAADLLPSFLSPSGTNGSCDGAICGKGACNPSNRSLLGLGLLPSYTCECDPGWTKLFPGDNFQFLPCIIPNCTLNYSCSNGTIAPAPSPPQIPSNLSIFDPCALAFCGKGECVKTSPITHRCDCQAGYNNLLNLTSFPCFQDCVLGADCSQLGIGLPSSTPPILSNMPPPSKGFPSSSSPPPPNFSNIATPPSRAIAATSEYLLGLVVHLIVVMMVQTHL